MYGAMYGEPRQRLRVDARTVLFDAALEYGLNVFLASETLDHEGAIKLISPDVRFGPRGASGISFRKKALVVEPDAGTADILHEMVHLIVGPTSLRMNEGYVLMPFEWRLAQELARYMTRTARKYFIGDVRDYQNGTQVSDFARLDEYGDEPRRTKWWRRGVERAKRLGLLESDGRPTFKCARWIGSGVKSTRLATWDPETDHLF